MIRWLRNLRTEGAVRRIFSQIAPGKRVQIDKSGWNPEPVLLVCEVCGPFEVRPLYLHPDHADALADIHLREHMHKHHDGPPVWEPCDPSDFA